MTRRFLFALTTLAVACGCANQPPPAVSVGTDHPANPNAEPATQPASSRTLDIEDVGASTQPSEGGAR